jgi:hypothetical protein
MIHQSVCQRIFEDGVRLRSFESGPRDIAEARTVAGAVLVEQFCGVFEKSGEALGLAAGGCDGKWKLKRRRWTEANLRSGRKGDSEKVKIAARLRRETIMTLK